MSKLDKEDIQLIFAALDSIPIGGAVPNGITANGLAVEQRIEQIKDKLGELEEEL